MINQQCDISKIKLLVANECDLIINIDHDVADSSKIIDQFYQTGSLYLGGVKALAPASIKKYNIKAVLTFMNDREFHKAKVEQIIDNSFDICQHMTLKAQDQDFQISPYVQSAKQFIDNALKSDQNVLVHCKDGIQKSPSIVAAYIMSRYHLSFDIVGKLMRERRVFEFEERLAAELKQLEQKQQIKQ